MSGSWPGAEIRTLPDGGREFILTEPKLTFIRIDMQSRLQFGEAQLEIETPFTLTTNDRSYELDPQGRGALAPLPQPPPPPDCSRKKGNEGATLKPRELRGSVGKKAPPGRGGGNILLFGGEWGASNSRTP